jgi:hypothetical protein
LETGYEIQIDEEARGDTRFNEQDGAFFSHTEAIYKIKQPGPLQGSGYKITISASRRASGNSMKSR